MFIIMDEKPEILFGKAKHKAKQNKQTKNTVIVKAALTLKIKSAVIIV